MNATTHAAPTAREPRAPRAALAFAALLLGVAALSGCASSAADAGGDPAAAVERVDRPTQRLANDNDPRGLHGAAPFTELSQAAAAQLPVIADADPRGFHGVPKAGTFGAKTLPSASPVNDNDPRILHGLHG